MSCLINIIEYKKLPHFFKNYNLDIRTVRYGWQIAIRPDSSFERQLRKQQYMQLNMLWIVSERKLKEIWLQVEDMSGGGELKKLTPTPSPEANRKEQVR